MLEGSFLRRWQRFCKKHKSPARRAVFLQKLIDEHRGLNG